MKMPGVVTEQIPVPEYVGMPAKSPHLTDRQFVWVTYRLSTMDDLEACAASEVPPEEVIEWRQDPRFNEFLAASLENKNRTFRDLTSHLLPETGRVIYRLLTSPNLKDQAKGAQMLIRVQGLNIDTVRVQDEAAITTLFAKLREPGKVEILDVSPRD